MILSCSPLKIDVVFIISSVFSAVYISQFKGKVGTYEVGIVNLIAKNYEEEAGSGAGGIVAEKYPGVGGSAS